VGIHGLVYSEDEMPDEHRASPTAAPFRLSAYRAKQILKSEVLLEEIDKAKTDKRCDELYELFDSELSFLPENWVSRFRDRIQERREELARGGEADDPNETLNQQFRDTIGAA